MAALNSPRTNTVALLLHMQHMPAEMEAGVVPELDELARLVERRMRMLAPKHRSLLAGSVHIDRPETLVREILPGVDYAEAMEGGVPAGGKGLPRFDDPAAADIVGWLRTQAFRGQRLPRKGSPAAQSAERQLRDRYQGLAFHIRRRGVKAHKFVEPTFVQLAPVAEVRLRAAVEAVLNRGGSAA